MVDRQKAFPNHRDAFSLVPDPVGMEALTKRAIEGGIESVERSFEDVNPHRRFPKFYRKHTPNFNDPMVLYYLLDALYTSQPGTYLRPTYISARLSKTAPMYAWNVDAVGRMMAGLWEACIENYLDAEDDQGMEYIPSTRGDGREIPDKFRMRHLPLARGRDAMGKYYVLDPDMTIEGRLWILKFRKVAADLSYKAMMDEKDGDLGAGMGKTFLPSTFYLSLSPDPIGSAQYFRRRDGAALHKIVHRVEIVDEDFWDDESET